jgi:hypothetical protein
MGDHDVEAGRLRDDRRVADDPGANRREHPLAAVLLGRDRDGEHLPVEPVRDTRGGHRPQRGEDRDDAALHVAGAAAVEPAVPNVGCPRIRGPRGEVAGRHDIDVADEQDPPPPGRPTARRRPAATTAASRRRAVRVGGERDRIRLDALRREADLAEQRLDLGLDRLLGTGDRGDPDEACGGRPRSDR